MVRIETLTRVYVCHNVSRARIGENVEVLANSSLPGVPEVICMGRVCGYAKKEEEEIAKESNFWC